MRTTAIADCAAASPAIPPTGSPRPASCRRRSRRRPDRAATIQDKWFARLFPVKALVIASLALFWVVSGFIALVISYDAAAEDPEQTHGFPEWLVDPVTIGTSLMDMSIGALIAVRRTAAVGLTWAS